MSETFGVINQYKPYLADWPQHGYGAATTTGGETDNNNGHPIPLKSGTLDSLKGANWALPDEVPCDATFYPADTDCRKALQGSHMVWQYIHNQQNALIDHLFYNMIILYKR